LGSGGGIYIEHLGTRLDVSGTGTQFTVMGNTAKVTGGGMAIQSNAILRSTSAAVFQSNTAVTGGGLGVFDNGGKEDGGGNCVQLSLRVQYDGTYNVDEDGKVDDPVNTASTSFFISTIPNSALSSINEREQVINKTTSWCVPCGRYTLSTSTGYQNAYFPGNTSIDLSISRNAYDTQDNVMLFTTDGRAKTVRYDQKIL
jgi:hypothetical protein